MDFFDVRLWDEYVPLYIVEQFSRIWIWMLMPIDGTRVGQSAERAEHLLSFQHSTALILYGIRIHLEFGEYANIVSTLLQLNMT